MNKTFALIKDNMVVNTIVCNDESFLETLEMQGVHQVAVRIDGCEVQPSIGWNYLLDNTHQFTKDGTTLLILDNELIEVIIEGQE